MHRRELLKNGAVALTVAATKPLFAWQGANNRVRMAVIGMGGRSGRVFDSLTRYDDVQFTMGCEVAQNKQTAFQSANRPLAQTLNVVGDYRRVLDRNDIDAVLIGTPDFSHARITADALAAGKHVYVEKPISNNIARINMMLDAYNKYPNLVVQVGTQQRSWDHFIEAKKLMPALGPVTHVLIQHGGGYAQNKQDVAEVPPGLDWDAWQVDAPKKAVQAGLHVVPRLVGVRQRPGRRLGRPPHRRRELVHGRRRQAAAQDHGGRLLLEPDDRSGVRLQPVLDRLAVRQLHHVVRQRRLPAPELRRSEGAGHRRLGRLLLRQQRDTAGEPHGLCAPAECRPDAQSRPA